MIKSEIYFFLNYNKPVLFTSYQKYASNKMKLKDYPHFFTRSREIISEMEAKKGNSHVYVFKNQKLLDECIQTYPKWSFKEKGELFGYQPSAIDLFEFQMKLKTRIGMNSLNRVLINAEGLQFVANEELFDIVLIELFQMYGIKKNQVRKTNFILDEKQNGGKIHE